MKSGVDRNTARSSRLIPALLDRMADHEPSRKTEGLSNRVMDKTQFRASVLRDLTWLLNTINAESLIDFDAAERAQASALNYGVPPLSGQQLAMDDWAQVEEMIATAITNFEPRILPDSLSVKVLPGDSSYALHNQLAMEIKGQLWCEPYPLELLLRSQIDLENGQIQITDAPGK